MQVYPHGRNMPPQCFHQFQARLGTLQLVPVSLVRLSTQFIVDDRLTDIIEASPPQTTDRTSTSSQPTLRPHEDLAPPPNSAAIPLLVQTLAPSQTIAEAMTRGGEEGEEQT